MRLRQWFESRGPEFVRHRAAVLLDRYGVTPSMAAGRTARFVSKLAEFGCAPTFPTPGRVVERHQGFVRGLQQAGAEITVHGFDHVDLRSYPPAVASVQLVRAAEAFRRVGIEVHGFRCPYLGCSDELLGALPEGLFDYSSNKAIWWEALPPTEGRDDSGYPSTVRGFYRSVPAESNLCLPTKRFGMLEIPVCVPDDLQLHDVLGLDAEALAGTWIGLMRAVHRRGELLVLLTHPELALLCEQSFAWLLQEARRLLPAVWISRLQDVQTWWLEKEGFSHRVHPTPHGLHVSFECSDRATILARGLDACAGPTWDGAYRQLDGREADCPAEPRPFVGLPASAPAETVSLLRQQGYILETGEEAMRCGLYLDSATLAGMPNGVQLVSHIEASEAPLLRYWRWPDAAKSALCVTGDLDALSLLDYAYRLFA